MKTVKQIAQENNMAVVTLYRRIVAKRMTPKLEKGIMVLNPKEKERLEKRYKKRSELMDKAKGDIQKMMELTGRFMGEDGEVATHRKNNNRRQGN